MSIEFCDCQLADVGQIEQLASRIWRVVYPEIISVEQIEFMLAWMYSPEKIRDDMARGVTYFFVEVDGEVAGYAAFGPDVEDSGTWLHKLYIAPEFHRRGLATAAICEIRNRLGEAEPIWLRVNRGNEAAIALYLKSGFSIVEERCSEIGGGFVMDDFVMRAETLPG